MVVRYAHPTEEHQFAAMDKMQRYIAKYPIGTLKLATLMATVRKCAFHE
jgi:hypothetical protein